MGASWRASGPRWPSLRGDVLPMIPLFPSQGDFCATAFNQLSAQIDKRSYVLLDNAPMHRSQAFIQQIPYWVSQGLIVKYLPSYSPELNLIEILWRFIKYYWLPFSAYTSFQCLCKAVEDILTRFGTDYTITFQTA